MKKFITLLLALALLAAVISGCGRDGSRTDGTGADGADDLTREIVVKLPTIQSGGPALIALELGFFEEQNLKIEQIGSVPGGNQIQSVITGDIDFTLGNHTDREIQALVSGIPVKVILAQSETTQDMPHMRWMVPEDSGIHEPKDLIGKKIAMSYITGGCPVTNLREYLRKGGVDLKQVQMVQMDDHLQAAALQEGLVDVITVHAPLSGVVRKQLNLRTLFSDYDTFDTRAGNNVATSEKVIKADPEKVRRFSAAFVKAQKWINENQEEASRIYAEFLKLDPALVKDFDRTFYSETGLETDERVQLWIDELITLGEIKPGQFKPSDIYTNEFNPNYKK
ncbi:MAG TPA: ABC transporter substrate-binding protein [Syntrophomonas sp.]|nr:ABC transporter substrate-binding protein [Syntrophomonas sp.]